MLSHVRKIASLMAGLFVLLVGHGVVGTLLGISGSKAGFSATELGVVMGAYSLGFIAGSRLTVRFIQRVGHIRYFAAMASASSTVFILHGLLVDVVAWTILRAICGFCMVGIYVAVESWLNQQAEASHRGGIFAVYMTVSMLAMAVGQVLLVLPMDDLALFALVSILYSLGLLPIAFTRQPEPSLAQVPPVSLRVLARISPMGVAGTVAAGLIHSSFYGMAAIFALARGMDEPTIALFIGSAILGGAVTLFPVGRWSDHRDRRRTLIFILLTTALASLAMLGAGGSRTITALSGFVYGAIAFNIYALSAAHLHDYLNTSQMLAATSGLQTLYGLGSVLGPIAVGILMSFTGHEAFVAWITGIALITGIFGLYRTTRRSPIPIDEQRDHTISARIPSLIGESLEDPGPEDNTALLDPP
ncbi:MAG: MFS transporter [Xanthomonadales bacterium]|nr:MFS transporter [Xanthomonadales bacterium]